MPKHRWDDDQPPLSKWQEKLDLEQRWQRKLQLARQAPRRPSPGPKELKGESPVVSEPPFSGGPQAVNLAPEDSCVTPATEQRKTEWPLSELDPSGKSLASVPSTQAKPLTSKSRRGPPPDVENHERVAKIVRAYGDAWRTEDSLLEICDKLDHQKARIPKTWPMLKKHPAHTWRGALLHHRPEVKKSIKYHCDAAHPDDR